MGSNEQKVGKARLGKVWFIRGFAYNGDQGERCSALGTNDRLFKVV